MSNNNTTLQWVKAEEIANKLADWSKKYPRGVIYSASNMNMDKELIALEEEAKEWQANKLVEETEHTAQEEEEAREEVYQLLNNGDYGLTASKAHKLQLDLCRIFSIKRKTVL